MPARTYPERELRGVIEQVNNDGAKVGGEWVNYGNYYAGERPGIGTVVVVTVKGKFVESLTVVGKASVSGPVQGQQTPSGSNYGSDDTVKRISRAVAVKAAIDMLTPGSKVALTLFAVTSLAEEIEPWLTDFSVQADGSEEAPF